MNVRSPHFTPVPVAFNARRSELPEVLRTPNAFLGHRGLQVIRGMPFLFGDASEPDVLLLDDEPVSIDVGVTARYVLFVHVVEDIPTRYLERFADTNVDGYELGQTVAQYDLELESGSVHRRSVVRRFAIQQARYTWGSAPFACVPAAHDLVFPSPEEARVLRRDEATAPLDALEEARTLSAIEAGLHPPHDGLLWLYALPNPDPEVAIRRVTLTPGTQRAAVYAITVTDLAEHPLRPGTRRKLRMQLPHGVALNAIGELEDIQIDLGTIISARASLDYDPTRWTSEAPIVEPRVSTRDVTVEYVGHPRARLYVAGNEYELDRDDPAFTVLPPARRPVTLRFLERETLAATPVRLHLHGEGGEYLPPRGYHRIVSRAGGADHSPDFVNVANQYAYVDGECVVDLPLGTVYVEISRGLEITPSRTQIVVGAETDEVAFELDRVLRWRERGWVTADTHVHFLSPQTALLEGKAEGVNVVNLLATQFGEMFVNVGDFDGKTTFGAATLGGSGEFLVRVGSENRTQVLGHISLLGYAGRLIQPLCTGGPSESAIGDPLETTMAEWAQRCLAQGGLVVMPHAPEPQLERAADIVLDLVDAIELKTHNPLQPDQLHLSAYGLADWYRYLNLGYHIPLVGGSDKMTAADLLGGIRTYVHLGDRELTYEAWMEAVRDGNTFATIGPLATFRVEGTAPGRQVALPAAGGTLQVEWEVESVRMPVDRVEIVVGGVVAAEMRVGGLSGRGSASVPITRSTWIALRVRGSYRGLADDISAHTSAVMVSVVDSELFSDVDAMTVLDQIQGALAYVDTIAPRPEVRRYKELRATLERAYNALHHRMHAAGIYHRHPLHDPGQPHEH